MSSSQVSESSSLVSPQAEAILARLPDPRLTPAMPLPGDIAGWQAYQAQVETNASANAVDTQGVTVSSTTLGGLPVIVVRPKSSAVSASAVYFHGGAYTCFSARTSLVTPIQLVRRTGVTLYSIDYPLAPMSRWQHTTTAVLAAMRALIALPDFAKHPWAMIGESAGGGLAAAMVMMLRDNGIDLPAALLAWSPWTDLSGSGDSYIHRQDVDPCLRYEKHLQRAAVAYAPTHAERICAEVSPLFGDVERGFVPTQIQVGSREILFSDASRFADKLRGAGCPVELQIFDGMPHGFQGLMLDAPEGQRSLMLAADFLRRYLLIEP
ncbi:Monoterpene epsilon-lactone hydrolase [BD1-7 clade bacterium]|nr:Monoterpene epsilon-lactone hydrolase [BD1-7 clade bacterium]